MNDNTGINNNGSHLAKTGNVSQEQRSIAMIQVVLALRKVRHSVNNGGRRSEISSDLKKVIGYLKYYA